MEETSPPVVLVVEDEPDVAETYEIWLSGEYEIRLAESGAAALEAMDDDVDVVLLDRMMPGMSGNEVLERIRERGYDVGVAMVSAVDPDFDIVEMGFDDYVTKPPTRGQLQETVERLLARDTYTDQVQTYRSLVAKRSALQTELTEAELAESEEYTELDRKIQRLDEELDGEDRLTDDAEFVSTLRGLTEDTDGVSDP